MEKLARILLVAFFAAFFYALTELPREKMKSTKIISLPLLGDFEVTESAPIFYALSKPHRERWADWRIRERAAEMAYLEQLQKDGYYGRSK